MWIRSTKIYLKEIFSYVDIQTIKMYMKNFTFITVNKLKLVNIMQMI